jgi:glucose-6-phosphate-specific signal transduction histidine kinase
MINSMTSARERISWLDIAFAVALSALGVLLMYANVDDPKVDASPLAIPLFLPVTLPLLWRRVAPVAALGAVLGALVVHDLLFGSEVVRCGAALPTMFLLVFSAAARLEQREALIGLGLGCAVIVAESITFFGAFGVFFVVMTVGIWAIGRIARSRAAMAAELSVRTAELREARDQRAQLEVATDRARLSAELDELLQRRLGELASLADAAARPADADAANAAFVEIERKSRRTLDEMRAVVGVLREAVGDAPVEPQPTLTGLEALLVQAKGGGARMTVEGNPRALPAGVELSAYRIVEQLLDALQDAPGVEVCVRFRDDALELLVSGPASRRSKQAIERARERVHLHRGRLEATTRGGRAEAVVSLPMLAGTS